MSKKITRRDTLIGAASAGLVGALSTASRADHPSSVDRSGPQTAAAAVPVSDPRAWSNPALIAHTQSARVLLNRERAREIMERENLDGLIATTPVNIYYLSSHRGPMQMMGRDFSTYAVFPRDEDAAPVLVIPGSMLYHLDYLPTWMPSIQVYTWPAGGENPDTGEPKASPFVSPWAMQIREGDLRHGDRVLMALYAEYHDKTRSSALLALKAAVEEAGLSRGNVGFDDPRVLPWLQDQGLKKLRGVDANNTFKEIRMVKTPNEIEILRQAAQRNEIALNYAIDQIEPGLPLLEIERAHARKWGELDGHARWLVTNVRGLNSGIIQRGDFMKLDSVGEYLGYLGDVGRSVSVGDPSDELAHRMETYQAAAAEVYAAIRPGMPFPESSRMFSDLLKQQGIERGPAGPHPVGLIHTDVPWPTGNEAQSFSQMDFNFEKNMVFTLDMPYHEIGWGTVHVEDMMLVTDRGAIPLSSGDISLRVRPV
jgi:Xaa-Pro dipeptidase